MKTIFENLAQENKAVISIGPQIKAYSNLVGSNYEMCIT